MIHVSQKVLEEAVRRFCPLFYLCGDDAFGHPCSFDFFIEQSRLVCSHPECNRVLVDVGTLTAEYLQHAFCVSCGDGENLMVWTSADGAGPSFLTCMHFEVIL